MGGFVVVYANPAPLSHIRLFESFKGNIKCRWNRLKRKKSSRIFLIFLSSRSKSPRDRVNLFDATHWKFAASQWKRWIPTIQKGKCFIPINCLLHCKYIITVLSDMVALILGVSKLIHLWSYLCTAFDVLYYFHVKRCNPKLRFKYWINWY